MLARQIQKKDRTEEGEQKFWMEKPRKMIVGSMNFSSQTKAFFFSFYEISLSSSSFSFFLTPLPNRSLPLAPRTAPPTATPPHRRRTILW
jgi:hypothetical protein